MDPLRAIIEESAAEVRGTVRFKIGGAGLMDAMKSSLSVLALLYFCLGSWTTAAAETESKADASGSAGLRLRGGGRNMGPVSRFVP